MAEYCKKCIKSGFILFTVLTLLNTLLFTTYLQAQVDKMELEAAYIERFTRFVEWPDSMRMSNSMQPFIIGLVGNVPFKNVLLKIYKQQKIKDKPVEIKSINISDKNPSCNLLFIGDVSKRELESILNATHNKPILTISSEKGFAKEGVLINLYYDHGRLKFEINESAFLNSRLKVSYLLLQYAKIIKKKGGQS